MIRTINEWLRRNNKEIVFSLENDGFNRFRSEITIWKGTDGKSAIERHMNREPNTAKKAMLNNGITDKDPLLQLSYQIPALM